MYGYEAAEKKNSKKGLLQNKNANNFYQRKLCWNTPVYHVLGGKDGDKRPAMRIGGGAGGGGGADTRREGLKEHSV